MEDREILELYFQRSEEAILKTEEKYGRYLTCVAQNILGCREDSEETVNDTYLAAWNSIPPAKPERLSTYLGKITRNSAIQKWRQKKAEKRGGGELGIAIDEIKEIIPSEFYAGSIEEEILLTDIFNRFLGALTKEKRIIFTRRYWHFSTAADIARDMGIGESKVRTALCRMRKELRKILEDEGVYL